MGPNHCFSILENIVVEDVGGVITVMHTGTRQDFLKCLTMKQCIFTNKIEKKNNSNIELANRLFTLEYLLNIFDNISHPVFQDIRSNWRYFYSNRYLIVRSLFQKLLIRFEFLLNIREVT